MRRAILLFAIAMNVFAEVRHPIVFGVFAAATRLRHPGLYHELDAQMRREIWWSIASAAI